MLPSASALACRREERVQKAFSVDHHEAGDARLSHSASGLYGAKCDYVAAPHAVGTHAPAALPLATAPPGGIAAPALTTTTTTTTTLVTTAFAAATAATAPAVRVVCLPDAARLTVLRAGGAPRRYDRRGGDRL